MVDSLYGLWRDVVVGSHDDNHKVGYLCASGTHCRECFVAWGVEECYVASVGELHAVRADVLCDAAGLACDNVGLADVVEQRGLAVVYVAHDGHYRRTALKVFLAVFLLVDSVCHFGRYILGGKAEFLGHDVDCLGIESLVDRHHYAEVHTCGDYVVYGYVHHGGEVVGGHELGDFEYAAFRHFGLLGLALARGVCFAFFLAPFGALLQVFVFCGKASQGLLYLLLYVFFAYLGGYGTCVAVSSLGLLAAVFATSAAVVVASSVAAATVVFATAVITASVAAALVAVAG